MLEHFTGHVATRHYINKINYSPPTKEFLDQLSTRRSIINEGESKNRQLIEREIHSFNKTRFDEHRNVPSQIWYDQLREQDNGSHVYNFKSSDLNIDYQHAGFGRTREQYLKSHVL